MTQAGRQDETSSSSGSLPSFERPPVVEVALGLTFEPLAVGAVGLAQMYEGLTSTYPHVEEQPALPSAITQGLVMEVGMPQLRLLMSDDEGRVLQLQRDRLVVNWRKDQESAQYPRYGAIRSRFVAQFNHVQQYTQSHGLGQLRPQAVEVTYVNVIEFPTDQIKRLADVLTLLQPAPYELGRATDTNLTLQFDTSDVTGIKSSTLVVNAQRDTGREPPILVLQLSAYMPSHDLDSSLAAFDAGRANIVRSFKSLTESVMHEIWGEIQ